MVEEEVIAACCSCRDLKKRIKELEEELHTLKSANHVQSPALESSLHHDVMTESCIELSSLSTKGTLTEQCRKPPPFKKCDLNNDDIARYSRQILLPEINAVGQDKLGKSSVLIIGAGGLGCPAALYLTACGIGHIGLVDYDTVDISNLQRQVLHTENAENTAKVDSAVEELKRVNSKVVFSKYNTLLSSYNCMEIINKYDIILDCSDNVATRYLLNDACIQGNKALVSGSALRWEGQLTVYNCNNGPCYRCLYPTPPPPEAVTNCSDAGVIGAVTGVIGALQALEAIKIITGNHSTYAGKLLLFDGLSGSFRNIKLRGRVKDCVVCGDEPSILQLQDYEEFCGSKADDKEKDWDILKGEHRISVVNYCNMIYNNGNYGEYDQHSDGDVGNQSRLMLDVRPQVEFEICSLVGSLNIPLSDILYKRNIGAITDAIKSNKEIFVLCKRGNESQKAVVELLKYVEELGVSGKCKIKDVIGGLMAWKKVVDPQLPAY